MRARMVDWALLGLTVVGIVTGLWSFLMGDPSGRWLFVAHGALGLAILGVLALKLQRVTPVVLSSHGRKVSATIGILTALATVATVGIGVWWVVVQTPTRYPNGMILHTTFGFVLLGFALWHLLVRFRPLRGRDVRDRRSVLRFFGVLAGGGALWAAIEGAQQVAGTAGSVRRFTGSRREETLPVTMWMFDNPAPLDQTSYTLEVGGLVNNPLRLGLAELAQLSTSHLVATLDCTGGWYSEQSWQGIRVGELLAHAEPNMGARYVRFRSATGYRWSLPLEEAADALLATGVANKPLAHGNGAPLRLVAPERRGFQWVKWVVAVEVLDAPDVGQWGVIFTSGLME